MGNDHYCGQGTRYVIVTKVIKLVTGVKYEAISEEGLIVLDRIGARTTIQADTIMLAGGFRPQSELAHQMDGEVSTLYLFGYCNESR